MRFIYPQLTVYRTAQHKTCPKVAAALKQHTRDIHAETEYWIEKGDMTLIAQERKNVDAGRCEHGAVR